MNYWEECLHYALEGANIKATKEQLKYIAEAVQKGHEMACEYSQSNDTTPDIKLCKTCSGTGHFTLRGDEVGTCHKCNGKGYKEGST